MGVTDSDLLAAGAKSNRSTTTANNQQYRDNNRGVDINKSAVENPENMMADNAYHQVSFILFLIFLVEWVFISASSFSTFHFPSFHDHQQNAKQTFMSPMISSLIHQLSHKIRYDWVKKLLAPESQLCLLSLDLEILTGWPIIEGKSQDVIILLLQIFGAPPSSKQNF